MKAPKLFYITTSLIAALSLASCSGEPIHIERTTTIDAPIDFVWEHTNSLADMNAWSPWMDRDPDMTQAYEGEDGTVGAVYSWSSEKEDVGSGSQTISEISDNSITTHLVFEGMGEADASMVLEEKDGMTLATWNYDQENPFPMNIIMMFIDMDEMLGPDYQQGVDNLKALVESNKASRNEFGGFTIEKVDLGDRTYLGVRDTVSMDAMQSFFAAGYAKTMKGMAKSGVEVAGAPSALYFVWDQENGQSEAMAAMPAEPGSMADNLASFSVSGPAIMIDYTGAYEGLMAPHQAMEEYMAWHKIEMNGPAIEEYTNDLTTVADASELNTKIYYPIK